MGDKQHDPDRDRVFVRALEGKYSLNDELNRLPATQARLALAFLRMACDALAKGNDPRHLIGLGGGFGMSLGSPQPQEYLELLEKLIVGSLDRELRVSYPPAPLHPSD